MSDLTPAFEAAVAATQELTQRPDNATLLKLYALYKQATQGDLSTPKPSLTDLVGRAKWDAWNALKNMEKAEAMRSYIDLVNSLD